MGSLPGSASGLPNPAIASIPATQLGVTPGQPVVSWQAPQDHFVRVASGTVTATGTPGDKVPIDVSNQGELVEKGFSGTKVVGHLDSQGNYQLVNGRQGNIFKEPEGTLKIDFSANSNPFQTALRETERQRAIQGSEIPLIREQLTNRGIDGRGIKIGILDGLKKEEGKNGQPDQWKLSDHTKTVANIVNDPFWGVAPGAQVVDAGVKSAPPKVEKPVDDINAYSQTQLQDYARHYIDISQQIYNLLQNRDPALRVLNITWGTDQMVNYRDVLKDINAKDSDGNYRFPNIRKNILGNAENGSDDDKMRAVINYVDNLYNAPYMHQAHQNYIEATRQAASQGLILVAAAGNEHDKIASNVAFPPGSEMDILAKSPYVITVAASNTNQTPGNHNDDTITPFSSRGDGQLYNPTLAAPGSEMGIGQAFGEMGHNLVVSGTSFSTPYVCAVIALMLQQNPNLTFDQIKAKLQNSATDTQASNAEEGAGILDPERAVLG